MRVRIASGADAGTAARLLDEFNREFDEPTPGVPALTDRLTELLETGQAIVLLAGDGADGIAVLRIRLAIFDPAKDALLEELYVVPAARGRGLGRALLDAAMQASREAGAERIEVTTSEDDTAARALYESSGFVNREKPPDGPLMLYYEREL